MPDTYDSNYDNASAQDTHESTIVDGFIKKWSGHGYRREMTTDLWAIIKWEHERCAKVSGPADSALE